MSNTTPDLETFLLQLWLRQLEDAGEADRLQTHLLVLLVEVCHLENLQSTTVIMTINNNHTRELTTLNGCSYQQ